LRVKLRAELRMQRTNHVAVIVSLILHQVLGFLWYGLLFFDPWLSGLGKRPEDINQADPIPFAYDIVGWLIAGYVVAWLVRATGSDTAGKGARLGALLWLGVAVPTLVPHYAFAGIRPIVTIIDALNALAGFVITGAVIGGWPRRRVTQSH
jgi:hypothetical protein